MGEFLWSRKILLADQNSDLGKSEFSETLFQDVQLSNDDSLSNQEPNVNSDYGGGSFTPAIDDQLANFQSRPSIGGDQLAEALSRPSIGGGNTPLEDTIVKSIKQEDPHIDSLVDAKNDDPKPSKIEKKMKKEKAKFTDKDKQMMEDRIDYGHSLMRVDSNAYINLDDEIVNEQATEGYCNLDANYDFNRMEEIGRGGFGVIYKVEDRNTGGIYAQKVLEVGKMKNSAKSAKRQFVCEAKVLFMCPHHDHIIKMIHTTEDKALQEYVITLELAPMGSVKDYWAGKIPIPEPTVQNYVKQILLGLQHLHRHKVVYRDLKLSNMLLMSENHLKLADFGISKVFDDIQRKEGEDFQSELRRLSIHRSMSLQGHHRVFSPLDLRRRLLDSSLSASIKEEEVMSKSESAESLRLHAPPSPQFDAPPSPQSNSFNPEEYRAKELVGTLFYQPPEMLKRTGHSFKMDIWSLGIIIWQMCFGGMPFLLRDKKQIKRIMKKGVRFPRNSEIAEEGEDFIQKCLMYEDERMSADEALQHPWIVNVEVTL